MITKQSRPIKTRISRFSRNLLEAWQSLGLPTSGDGIVVAVSGGADSTALLLGLNELIAGRKLDVKLIVAHLDHGLRQESRNDAKWVSDLAKQLGHEVVVGRRILGKSLRKRGKNLEQEARQARYSFLHQTARKRGSELVLTAHTLDDQAETILLRLLRGSAAEGLSGTSLVREIERGSEVRVARPLLARARRTDTEDFCRLKGIDFRRDEMNEDESFSRVRVRKLLLPLMKSFNNRIVETLNRTATLLNEDTSALANEASRLLKLASRQSPNSQRGSEALDVKVLSEAPAALRRRALREWILHARGDLRRLERVHLLAVENLIESGRGGRVAELPGGMKVTRRRGLLELSGRKVLKKRQTTSKIPRR